MGAGQTSDGDTANRNFLDQLLIVGIQGIQPVDFIVFGFMCCGIAQDCQRRKFFERIECFGTFQLLGFIENHDRMIALDDINRFPRLKIIQLLIDATGILSPGIECLHIDDHDVNAAIRGELLQMMQLLGIVDEEPGALFVFLHEVFGGNLEGFIDSFANRNRRHHDDKLGPAIAAVQLEHGLDVAIGFTGAGFHFDIEINRTDLGADQCCRSMEILPLLHGMDVRQKLILRQ